MQSLWRASLVAGLAVVALTLLAPANAHGQDKPKSITFKTADGVTLSGSLYSAGGKSKKDGTVVMLLHNFDAKKGGGSSQRGWSDLAKVLQEAGYHVLSFDFRGFGDSKEVNKESFWKHKHNVDNIKHNRAKPPETIDHKDFGRPYYAFLINDIAAAKAYLDRANDRKELNSSNLVIVGAGQGATLGAMWVANEGYRRRDKNPSDQVFAQPNLAEPEAKDVAGCVWLTLSSSIESRMVGGSLRGTWLPAATKTSKIPMGFFFGKGEKNDAATPAEKYATDLVKYLKSLDKEAQVGSFPVEGSPKLIGNDLLDTKTNARIVEFVDKVIKVRGSREMLDKKVESSNFYYQTTPKGRLSLNKKAGEEVPPVDLSKLLP